MRVLLIGLAALVTGSIATAQTPAAAAHLARSVSAAIANVSGTPVRVRCDVTDGGYIDLMGHADRRHRLIELHPGICRRLDDLAAPPAPVGTPAFAAESEALLVAMHEAVHLSPYGAGTDEALVECRAVQLVATAAVQLGSTAAQADALGHAALAFHQRLPGLGDRRVGLHGMPNYQSSDCYDGGPLDIHPESSDWPN